MSVIVSIISKFDDKGIVGAQKQFDRFGKAVKPASKMLDGLGIAAGSLIGVGVGAWLLEGVNKAKAAEASWATLGKVVDNSGVSFKEQKPAIDAALTSASNYAAVGKGDLRPMLQNLILATGNTKLSLAAMNVTTDLARAKNMDLSKAGQLVGRALAGNTTALKRYGIVLQKNATPEQVLVALEKKLGGTAGAWAKTAEGRAAMLNVKLSALQTNIGTALLPAFNKLTDYGLDLANALTKIPQPVMDIGVNAGLAAGGVIALSKALTTLGVVSGAGAGGAIAAAIIGAGGAQLDVMNYIDQNKEKVGELQAAVESLYKTIGGVFAGPLFGPMLAYNKVVMDGAAKMFGFKDAAAAAGTGAKNLSGDFGAVSDKAKNASTGVDELKTSLLELEHATMTSHDTTLAAIQADIAYKEAIAKVNTLQRQGKTNTEEYRLAVAEAAVATDKSVIAKRADIAAHQRLNVVTAATTAANGRATASFGATTAAVNKTGREIGTTTGKAQFWNALPIPFKTASTNFVPVGTDIHGTTGKLQTWNGTPAQGKYPDTNFPKVADWVQSAIDRVDVWNNTPAYDKTVNYTTNYITHYQTVGAGGPHGGSMAVGGIVNRPLVALIGEAGPEAVIPLSAGKAARRRQLMKQAGLSGGGTVVNQTNNNYFTVPDRFAGNIEQLADLLAQYVAKRSRRDFAVAGVTT